MQTAIDAFRTSIARAGHLGGLHDAMLSLTTEAIDASDILRAQVVLGVSALDYYIHEITVLGMVEVLNGHRQARPHSETTGYRLILWSAVALVVEVVGLSRM